MQPRRTFLKTALSSAATLGLGDIAFLGRLPLLSAEEVAAQPQRVQCRPEMEPLVRLIEDTPRQKLLEEIGARVRKGLSYQDVLAALMLAGVRNIQPRPIGFKFHAVLVVNSAHLASLASPDSERWLPIFWALDHFKSSQAQDVKEGDWTMQSLDHATMPSATKVRAAFTQAMDKWDEPAADIAAAALARTSSAHECFELFCRYGARDFRDIGHKAIYVANSWRTLQCIGWQHAEPILRSLAYGLLDRRGDGNPADLDLPADRPGRRNWELKDKIRADWLDGERSNDATTELLETCREASAMDVAKQVVEFLNRKTSPQSIWDTVFCASGELLMRRPGIQSLHAVTTTNALHFAWQHTRDDSLRRFLLLQAASFVPLFRGTATGKARIDQLKSGDDTEISGIFEDISSDRGQAARGVMSYLGNGGSAKEFCDAARLVLFFKGRDAHDYKFSSAVLEDWANISPVWRDRYLASSVYQLRGSAGADNEIVKRARAALTA